MSEIFRKERYEVFAEASCCRFWIPGIPDAFFGYINSQPQTAEFSLGEIWEIFES